jgi:hypothetical protein
MTLDELRRAIESKRDEFCGNTKEHHEMFGNSTNVRTDRKNKTEGFDACLELVWPVIAAAERCASYQPEKARALDEELTKLRARLSE